MAKEVPVVVGLSSVSAVEQARGRCARFAGRAYRVEGLDVRVPDVVGQLSQARKDGSEARALRRRALGQWHGGRWTRSDSRSSRHVLGRVELVVLGPRRLDVLIDDARSSGRCSDPWSTGAV